MESNYIEMMSFITAQNQEWKNHCKQLGWFKSLFEKLFGSKFAEQQSVEFELFLLRIKVKQ